MISDPLPTLRAPIQRLRYVLCDIDPIYRISLCYKGGAWSPDCPPNWPINTTLKSEKEYKQAQSILQDIGLHQHPDPPKNWDHLSALSSILNHSTKSNSVLDAGGAKYSPLVEWLYLYGYRDLHVLNLEFENSFSMGSIQYTKGDITNSDYNDESFDVITSMSVIEHGLNIESFMDECSRLLKPGGRLILSTDYWTNQLDSESVEAYGVSWNPFSPTQIKDLISTAEAFGFSPSSEVDLKTDEATVDWEDESFTFIVLEFIK